MVGIEWFLLVVQKIACWEVYVVWTPRMSQFLSACRNHPQNQFHARDKPALMSTASLPAPSASVSVIMSVVLQAWVSLDVLDNDNI